MPARKNSDLDSISSWSNWIIKAGGVGAAITALATGIITAVNYLEIRPILSKEFESRMASISKVIEDKFNALDARLSALESSMTSTEMLTDVNMRNVTALGKVVVKMRVDDLRAKNSTDPKEWQAVCDLTRDLTFYNNEIPEECKNYPPKLE